jgi:NAD(P)-dependent dehydrogenase (short-subunit alcohol dehydrogenase family)
MSGPRVALVTGGGRGMGRAIALALGTSGHAVGIVARSEPDLAVTRSELESAGIASSASVADVVDLEAMEQAVRTTEEELGPIGVLVNNAGTGAAVGPAWEVDPDDWWGDVESSLKGTFNACRAVIPGMIARGEGRIINVSSYAAVRAAPYQTGYAAAKAAVASFTEGLAASLADYGVRVFTITPGFVRTALTTHLIDSESGRRWLPELQAREPLDPELGASLVVFLAGGGGDRLSGRFLHALDDVQELLARIDEIEGGDLYALRLRRLGA